MIFLALKYDGLEKLTCSVDRERNRDKKREKEKRSKFANAQLHALPNMTDSDQRKKNTSDISFAPSYIYIYYSFIEKKMHSHSRW